MKIGDIKLGKRYVIQNTPDRGDRDVGRVLARVGGGFHVDIDGQTFLVPASDVVAIIGRPTPLMEGKDGGSAGKKTQSSIEQRVRARSQVKRPKPLPRDRGRPAARRARPEPLASPPKRDLPEEIPTLSRLKASLEYSRNRAEADKRTNGKGKLSTLLKAAETPPVPFGCSSGKNISIRAGAGTGKTTTIIGGVQGIMGVASDLKATPQQLDIWKAMKSAVKPNSIALCAFNTAIAKVLAKRVPQGCEASTIHSRGYRVCAKTYRLGRDDVNKYKTEHILEELIGKDLREVRKERPLLLSGTRRLVELCKLRLEQPEPDILTNLCSRYGIDVGGEQADIYKLVPDVLEKSRTYTKMIDYADMIWLPVVNNLPIRPVDVLAVDERQDLNLCQQALALRMGRRIVAIGDPHQAIYGFAGADTEATTRMNGELAAMKNGLIELPLTVTFRCGQEIVKLAREIVPDYEAHPSNPKGEIKTIKEAEINDHLKDGDMVMCRINAPLVSLVFRLIRQRRKATIQGRNIGEQLAEFISGFGVNMTDDLLQKVDDFHAAELRRLNQAKHPNEDAVIALNDRIECVRALCEQTTTVPEVKTRIDQIFQDGEQPGVLLSSMHRAKGLEADRTFILEPQLLPHPMAKQDWQLEQESNLKYVAITRAKHILHWVTPKKAS